MPCANAAANKWKMVFIVRRTKISNQSASLRARYCASLSLSFSFLFLPLLPARSRREIIRQFIGRRRSVYFGLKFAPVTSIPSSQQRLPRAIRHPHERDSPSATRAKSRYKCFDVCSPSFSLERSAVCSSFSGNYSFRQIRLDTFAIFF